MLPGFVDCLSTVQAGRIIRSVGHVSLCALLLITLLCSATVSPAQADGVADEAEINFQLGAERYQGGDYRAALAYFLVSNRLAPNRKVRFNIARTFQRLQQFPEAHRWCVAALEGETDKVVRAQLEETLRSIEAEVAILDVTTTPPGATVYLDRRDLGSVATTPSRIALPAGEHRVLLELAGYEELVSEPVQVGKGGVVPLVFALRRITGSVEVSAEAPTEVRMAMDEGAAACTTPCRLELAPGVHTLHFRRPGHRARPRQVRVTAGETATVQVESSPYVGSIVVTAEESDALVQIDGASVGFTPAVLPNVPVGERSVRLTLRGFEPLERKVIVQEGRETALRDLRLVPSRTVTSASRLSQSIDDAPASVSIVSARELAAFRYPTIYEALRGQRGVALSYDGAYSSLSLRGLGQPGDYSNRTLVLTDGSTLNDNVLSQAYIGYDGRVDLGDVERIELVRGPGSVLYGTGAVTGVVNLVPRDPPQLAFVEGHVIASDARTARATLSGGVPWGRNDGLTLSAAGAHSEGERITLSTPGESISVDGVNRFDAATLQSRLRYGDLTVQAFFTRREQDIPQGAYGGLVGDDRNTLVDTRALLEARYEPTLTRHIQLFTRLFGNGYWFAAEQAYEGETEGSRALVDERYRGLWVGAEARVVASLAQGLRLTAGSEIQVSPVASLEGSSREAGVTERFLDANEDYRIYAAYGLLEWQAVRWLRLSAGARADAWSTFGATVNPRAAVILRPTSDDVIKLMAGRAFRAPSIYELRYTDGGATQVASDFDGNELRPETVWSGELEYTRTLGEGWFALTSIHAQRAEDLIEQAVSDPTFAGSPVYYRNSASSIQTLGAELEVRHDFRAGFMFASSYGYLVARYEDAAAGEGSRKVPNAPNHFASVRGVAPLSSSMSLALRNSLEAPRRIATDARARTSTAVITDLVLTGEVARSGLDYAVGLYNLFDWRLALPTDPTFVTRTMPQAGRTLLVSIGIRR